MQIDLHPLSVEFPQFKDTIRALKQGNAHFSKLFDEYDDADKAINRAENGVEHLGDAALDHLKKLRVALKDQLLHLLQAGGRA